VPQFIPMAFIHTRQQALLAAVLIGLMGAWRTRPASKLAATFALSMRGGDVLGSWIYGLSPKYGFQYCVIAITVTYALILPVIPFTPNNSPPLPMEKRTRKRKL
jgi:hypothetical protein